MWFGVAAAAFGGESIPFSGQLAGRVSTPAGLPQMGASVALFNRYDAVVARTLTSESGGFEFALASDFIIASDTAKFALPEITLGIFPGGGGTQRLTRLIGKSKAMEMILTGRMMDAIEAERLGIVARVVTFDQLMAEAIATAEKIAGHSGPAVEASKRAVNEALESPMANGLKHERAAFYNRFDSVDQKEGMAAFLEKRKAVFVHK